MVVTRVLPLAQSCIVPVGREGLREPETVLANVDRRAYLVGIVKRKEPERRVHTIFSDRRVFPCSRKQQKFQLQPKELDMESDKRIATLEKEVAD